MSTGLIALLDDIAALAKVAAASLDDVAAGAAKAGVKAAGIVIDDAAVTPGYAVGFAADRELPIVAKIAVGSLRNKLLYLLPGALGLSLVAPWAITPLLMLGGGWLCYEGTEKVYEVITPRRHHASSPENVAESENPRALEEQKVREAIRTDLILSAEIMAITLATVSDSTFLSQAAILAIVGVALTILVYGAVALIVKADDVGLALALADAPVSALFGRTAGHGEIMAPHRMDMIVRPAVRWLGRGFVLGMPPFLNVLKVVGTAAMIWVGGGVILHGLEAFGLKWPGDTLHIVMGMASHVPPAASGVVEWVLEAAGSGIFGLLIGAVVIPIISVSRGCFSLS